MRFRNKSSGVVHRVFVIHEKDLWYRISSYQRNFIALAVCNSIRDYGIVEVVGNKIKVTCKQCLRRMEARNGNKKV